MANAPPWAYLLAAALSTAGFLQGARVVNLSKMRAVAVFGLLVAAAAPVHAQDVPSKGPEEGPARSYEDPRPIISLQIENDTFAKTDRYYTNGFRLTYMTPETTIPGWIDRATEWLPFFAPEGNKRLIYSLGQSMFTPEDITTRDPDEDDRPYAGFLYGSIALITDTGERLDTLELTLGIIGPYALAKETQKLVHDIIGADDPKGWDKQLHTEPAVMLTYERKWRGLYEFRPGGFGVDATPYLGGSLGNVFTQASAGMMFRLGQDLPADYGPPRIRPSLPGSDFFIPTQAFGWYLFGGIEGRAVAHNIFLDGNTFQDSPDVDKKWFVGDFQFGAAIVIENVRIAYTHVFRTKEFDGQNGIGEFGAFTLSLRF